MGAARIFRDVLRGRGGALPLPLWERVGVRGYGLSLGRNPSPGSHLSMRSDLSHKGRGGTEHAAISNPEIAMLQIGLGDQRFRRSAPHRVAALDDVMPVGDAREILDVLVDHQHRLASRL